MAAEYRTAEANTGAGELPPVKRNRSLRRLLPGKHGISASSPTSIQPPESGSRFPSGQPPAPRPQQPPYHSGQNRGPRPNLHLPPRSSSNDSYYSTPGPAPHLQNVRPVPSEAARLRSLNSGQHSPINPEPRYKSDIPPQPENFSRPRKISIKGGDERPRLVVSPSFTYPSQTRSETPTYNQRPELREGGFPDSTSLSTNFVPSRSLRNSSSIPDHIVEDPPRSVSSNSIHFRGTPGYGDHNPNHRREQTMKPSQPGEELRESFRSVQTTGTTGTGTTWMTNTTATTCVTTPSSSFLEASGTERSSVVSKYSSASMNGRDQIDDFLDMYEDGFADSGNEDGSIHRPPTIRSVRSMHSLRSIQNELSNQTRITDPGADSLPIPKFSNLIIRDSTEMFRTAGAYMDPFDEGNGNGTPNSHVNTFTSHQSQSSQRPPTAATTRKFSRRGKAQPQPSPSRFDPSRDRYGFKKKSQYISLADYENWNIRYVDHLARRKRKWVALMKESGLDSENPTTFPPQSTKTKRFIRKGIPPDWRGEAWFWYAGGRQILANNPGIFAELVRRAENGGVSPTDDEIIERDLHRTFPDNILFKPDPVTPPTDQELGNLGTPPSAAVDDETPMLKSLRRVLQATSIYNPKIGYCQSLNFLAGLLLLFMDEERAFWMLDIITKSYLPGTHEVNLEGANVDLGVLVTSIKESMPGIWAKIGGELDGSAAGGAAADDKDASRLPPITLCCTAWFMSCFIGTLPVETTLRVWDAFFYEGSKTLFRIALAVFKVGEPEIRAVADPMEIFQVVQTIPRRLIDANALMDACFRRRNGFGHLTQGTIDERRAERRRGYADARAVAAGRRPASSRKGRMFSGLRTRK